MPLETGLFWLLSAAKLRVFPQQCAVFLQEMFARLLEDRQWLS